MPEVKWVIPTIPLEIRKTVYLKNNWKATRDLTIRLLLHSVIFLAITICLLEKQWFMLFVLSLLNGGTLIFLGWAGIGHEFFHKTVFSNKYINIFFFRAFSCLTLNNWGWFEFTHWLHHKFTLHDEDPEGAARDSIAKRSIPKLVLIDFAGFIRRLWILILNSFQIIPINNEKINSLIDKKVRKHIQFGAISVLLYQAIQFVFISQFSVFFAVVMLFAPFTFSLLNDILETVQHLGLKRNANDFRDNTRTIVLGKFSEFLYSNMNYHIEHHMFPGVPYYNLPLLRNYLISQNLLNDSHSGLKVASKIAFGLHNDCLNCKLQCPVTPTRKFNEN